MTAWQQQRAREGNGNPAGEHGRQDPAIPEPWRRGGKRNLRHRSRDRAGQRDEQRLEARSERRRPVEQDRSQAQVASQRVRSVRPEKHHEQREDADEEDAPPPLDPEQGHAER